MWTVTSNIAGIAFAVVALSCWGSWSTTLVLTAKTMPWECFYFNFAISFLLTGIVVGFVVGEIPGGDDAKNYADQLFDYDLRCYGYAILGGVMWNAANILLCKGIGLMGQALGFPMCVGLGLISGSITNYVIDGSGVKPGLLFGGDAIALVAICFVGLLSKRKNDELAAKAAAVEAGETTGLNADVEAGKDGAGGGGDAAAGVSTLRKYIICLVGGLLLGLSNIGVVNATSGSCKMSPPANQTFFSVGVFICSALLVPITIFFPVEGWAASTTIGALAGAYGKCSIKDHLLAVLGGFLVCLGFFAYNLGNATDLGPAPTYSIGQSAPIAGIMWGTFFFKEFAGTSVRVWGLIPLILALFLGAIVCLALSS